MTEINYPLAGIFVLIAIALLIWMFRANQKDKKALKKMFPDGKSHRKHLKKNKLHP
jgi:preprotein translocase subunit YajC